VLAVLQNQLNEGLLGRWRDLLSLLSSRAERATSHALKHQTSEEATDCWRDPSIRAGLALSCTAQDDTALWLNIFANDFPNHPKPVLDEPTVAPDQILRRTAVQTCRNEIVNCFQQIEL